jgi:uncharacterized protein (TIGR03083 family)
VSQSDRTVITALFDQWRVLDDLLAGLTDTQWSRPTALPGWTVQDVVAHVIGTEAMLAGRATPPAVDPRPHVRNDIGAMNEAWVESMRAASPADMVAAYRDIVDVRTRSLTAMTDDEFAAPAMTPVGPGTYASFMQIRLFDCWMHELDIRDAVGSVGDEGGIRADLAFDTFDKAIPFVVGKKAQTPDGARVLVRLTGPLERTYRVVVDGRAKLTSAFEEPETTSITMNSGLYARLCGGRDHAPAHRDEMVIDGDLDVGHRIVDALAVTM